MATMEDIRTVVPKGKNNAKRATDIMMLCGYKPNTGDRGSFSHRINRMIKHGMVHRVILEIPNRPYGYYKD